MKYGFVHNILAAGLVHHGIFVVLHSTTVCILCSDIPREVKHTVKCFLGKIVTRICVYTDNQGCVSLQECELTF